MKAVMSCAAALVCLGLCSPAVAGGSYSGPVSHILSHRQGRLFFEVGGTRYLPPSCAIHPRWVIDTTMAAGQSVAATVLSAYALGKSVVVEGTAECGVWGDTETANYVEVLG